MSDAASPYHARCHVKAGPERQPTDPSIEGGEFVEQFEPWREFFPSEPLSLEES